MSQQITVNAHGHDKFVATVKGLPSLLVYGVEPSKDETVVHIARADDCYLNNDELKRLIAWLQAHVK